MFNIILIIYTGFECAGNTLALGLISSYFTSYYDVAVNTVVTALPLAVMVSAPLTQLLIDVYGWRSTLILFSGLNLHYIAAAAVLKPTRQIQTDEKEIYYKPLTRNANDAEPFERRSILSICFDVMLNVSLFKNGRFLIVFIVSIVTGYTFNGWAVYLVSIAQSKGLSPSDAANVATISGFGAIFIRIILAILQDKTSYKNLLPTGLVVGIISYGGMYFTTSFWSLSIYGITLGISYGLLGSQIYIGANSIVEKDDAVGAVAWVNLAYGLGYISSGYVSGKFYFNIKMQDCNICSVLPFLKNAWTGTIAMNDLRGGLVLSKCKILFYHQN